MTIWKYIYSFHGYTSSVYVCVYGYTICGSQFLEGTMLMITIELLFEYTLVILFSN